MFYEFLLQIKKFSLSGATLFLVSALTVGSVFSQTNDASEKKTVKWNMLSGTDKEIFLAVPDNSILYSSGNFYLSSNGAARVDSIKTLISSLNNSVFQVDFYEGRAEEIQKKLLQNFRENLSPVKIVESEQTEDKAPQKAENLEIKNKETNGFYWTDVKYKSPECFWHIQFFRVKTRLYVLKTVSRSENNALVKSFFEAVKLVSKDKAVSPNFGEKIEDLSAAKMKLPPTVDVKQENSGETEKVYEAKELDKSPVVIHFGSPNLDLDKNYFYNSFNVIKVKVLLQADGTVGKVEPVTKTAKAIEKRALENAKDTKFLPAEKNGKPVSTYVTLQYSLTIG